MQLFGPRELWGERPLVVMSESKALGLKVGACMLARARRWPSPVGSGASLSGPGQQPPASGPQREQSLQPSDLATQQSQGPGFRTSALRTAQGHEDRVPRSLPQ